MSLKEELQNAHSARFLGYGHLGRLKYDEDAKRWTTLRIIQPSCDDVHDDVGGKGEPQSAFPFHHLMSNVVHGGYPASQHYPESQSETSVTTGSETDVPDNPGKLGMSLQPDASLRDRKHLPNCSQLLAFGNAVAGNTTGSGLETFQVPIAGSVSERNGKSIRLVVLAEEVAQSPELGSGSASVRIPSMHSNHDTYWTGDGDPVQQICFAAETGYSSTWMAARSQSSTTVFNPTLQSESKAPQVQIDPVSTLEPSPSSLDANPVLKIPISRTGGHSHADIAFNPHDHSRLALIDDHGTWSVWLIDNEQRESLSPCLRLSLVFCGQLWTWDHEKRLQTSRPHHDGWHRISWCNGSGTDSGNILVCNRRTAAVYNSAKELVGLTDLRLGKAWENQCILDVQRSSYFKAHFVLTSSRLFWFSFTAEGTRESVHKGAPHLVLAWRHFRKSTDKTLHLVLLDMGPTTTVLIASRLVGLVSVFRVGLSNDGRGHPASLADPVLVVLPSHPTPTMSQHHTSSLVFRVLEERVEGEATDRRTKPLLVKLFSLSEDLSVVEHLYLGMSDVMSPSSGSLWSCILPLPDRVWLGREPLKTIKSRKLDGFIESVGGVDGEWTFNRRASRDPSKMRQRRGYQAGFRQHVGNSLDWQDVYTYLLDDSRISDANLRPMGEAFTNLSKHANKSRPGTDLVSEIVSSGQQITDVDHDSGHFEKLISTLERQVRPDREIKRFPVASSASMQPNNLISIYESIIQTQLAPLSAAIPDRIRVNRERLARSTALDLLLATAAISPTLPELNGPLEPIIALGAIDRPRADSLALPALPLSSSPPSSTGLPATPTTAIDDQIFMRLGIYTDVSPLKSDVMSTNPSLRSILRHLPTSADVDPSTYDYQATERALAAEKEEEAETAAAQADPRARRKAEKTRIASAKKERAKRKAAEEFATSQRLPPKILSSQTLGQGRELGRNAQSSQTAPRVWDGLANSSQEVAGVLAVSQPVEGAFGQRSSKRDKSKKRAAGF